MVLLTYQLARAPQFPINIFSADSAEYHLGIRDARKLSIIETIDSFRLPIHR